MKREVLRFDRVTYLENETPVLTDCNFHLFSGEILGLIPLNSVGLDRLMDLVENHRQLHYGRIYFNEIQCSDYLTTAHGRNKVASIEKRSHLIDSLTVCDNIFMVRDTSKYLVNEHKLLSQFQQAVEELNISVRGDERVDELTALQRCQVELIKAVVTGAKVIILRELSTFLSSTALAEIQSMIRFYAMQGIAFLYLCNHHQEVFRICDRVLLLKDGKIIRSLGPEQMNEQVISQFSKPFEQFVSKLDRKRGACSEDHRPVFQSIHVSGYGLRDLDFTVGPGECVVLFDLDGHLGETLRFLLFSDKIESGLFLVESKRPSMVPNRWVFMEERPITTMLFPDLSYIDNLSFCSDRKVPRFWSRRRFRTSLLREFEGLLGPVIYAEDLYDLTPSQLYDLIYWRTVLEHPAVVFCVQPFSSVDMYQRMRIIEHLERLKRHGIAVVIISVSLSDSLQVADRMLPVSDGRIIQTYEASQFDTIPYIAGSRPQKGPDIDHF